MNIDCELAGLVSVLPGHFVDLIFYSSVVGLHPFLHRLNARFQVVVFEVYSDFVDRVLHLHSFELLTRRVHVDIHFIYLPRCCLQIHFIHLLSYCSIVMTFHFFEFTMMLWVRSRLSVTSTTHPSFEHSTALRKHPQSLTCVSRSFRWSKSRQPFVK